MSKTNILNKFDLTDKVAVITGGAGLMGRMHAQAITDAGGVAVIVDIKGRLAQAVAKEIGGESLGIKTDITSKEDVQKLLTTVINKFGRTDILINNAANDPKVKKSARTNMSRFENFDIKQWQKDLDVGLTGAFLCSQVFGTHMAKKGGGVILNIASDLGIIAPDQRIYRKKGLREAQQSVKPVTYSVAKHGLIGLTKYCATYWAQKGVRVNALCPGGIYAGQPKDFVKKLTTLIPLGRMAKQDEYQAAVLFLVSQASSYVTGSVISADGGRTCW
jgi:NAD(P)-dependent dehydrogenase (short-subunit alcohol dehydrogenase family)